MPRSATCAGQALLPLHTGGSLKGGRYGTVPTPRPLTAPRPKRLRSRAPLHKICAADEGTVTGNQTLARSARDGGAAGSGHTARRLSASSAPGEQPARTVESPLLTLQNNPSPLQRAIKKG